MPQDVKLLWALTPIEEGYRQADCHIDYQDEDGNDCSKERESRSRAIDKARPQGENDTDYHGKDDSEVWSAEARTDMCQWTWQCFDTTHGIEHARRRIDTGIRIG